MPNDSVRQGSDVIEVTSEAFEAAVSFAAVSAGFDWRTPRWVVREFVQDMLAEMRGVSRQGKSGPAGASLDGYRPSSTRI